MEGEIVTSQNTAVHTDHGVSINPGPCAWGVHGRNSYLSPKVSRTYRREETYVVCPAVLGAAVKRHTNAVYSTYILHTDTRSCGLSGAIRRPARGVGSSARPWPGRVGLGAQMAGSCVFI